MTIPQNKNSTDGSSVPTSNSTDMSTDGLRHRNVNNNAENNQYTGPSGYTWHYPPGQVSHGENGSPVVDSYHQMNLQHQMYANYMAYMKYLQMASHVAGVAPNQVPYHVPMTSNLVPSTVPVTTDQNDQQQQQQPPPLIQENILPQPQVQPQPQPQQPQVGGLMNAQGGDLDEEDGIERDWLDWIYLLSRMVFLLWIIISYSTLNRALCVIGLTIIVYLYQAGWFTPERRVAPEPPRENNENNQVNGNNNPDQEMNREQNQDGVAAEQGNTDEAPVRPVNYLALSWTFVSSLLSSLIPERPEVI